MNARAAWCLAGAVLAGAAACRTQPREATIRLAPERRYQTMTGWEATAWAGDPGPSTTRYIGALLDQAVNDLGLDRLRVEVRSGAENERDYWSLFREGEIPYDQWRSVRYSTVNDNDDPFDLDADGFRFAELDWQIRHLAMPMRARLQARGESLFLNLNYVAFTGQIGEGLSYLHDDPEEYGEFVLAVYRHLDREFGVVPDACEVILEPDNVDQWDGTLLGRAILAAARRLEADGYEPRFIAPSTTSMAAAVEYFDQMIDVPGALPHLSELSYHRYRGVSESALRAIGERALRHGVRTAQLEKIGATHEALHQDLAIGLNSAWAQYTLAGAEGKDNGGSYYVIDASDPGRPEIRLASRTRYLRQYFKFVRRKAQRIGAEASDGAFEPLAFVNADGGFVVVVKAAEAGKLSVEGLPAGVYGIKYTTDEEYGVDAADVTVGVGGNLRADMPDAGVMTVYAKRG